MPFHLTEAQLNEPIAGHMRGDFTTLYPHWTVGEALDHMRRTPPPGRIIYFYVVDESMRLVGRGPDPAAVALARPTSRSRTS